MKCEIAFKEWCEYKKRQATKERTKKKNRRLSYEQQKKLYRKHNIERYIKRPYTGRANKKTRVAKSKKYAISVKNKLVRDR